MCTHPHKAPQALSSTPASRSSQGRGRCRLSAVAAVSPPFLAPTQRPLFGVRLSPALWASAGECSCLVLSLHLGGAIRFHDPPLLRPDSHPGFPGASGQPDLLCGSALVLWFSF